MVKKHIYILIALILVIKTGYVAISISVGDKHDNFFKDYVTALNKNDSYWYKKIAENGYPNITKKEDIGYSNGAIFKQSSWAFFPFYPYLLKSTMYVLGIDFETSAFFWSLFFSIAMIIGFYWFGTIFFKNNELAFYTSCLLIFFPFTFYFSVFFTEVLFLTFVIFSFITVHYKRLFLLFFLLIPLVLLRPNGIIVILPLYIYFLEKQSIIEKNKIKWNKVFEKNNLLNSLFFISGPIVFLVYCFYQYSVTGYFFAFSIAQQGWYREFMLPFLSFFRSSDLNTQFNSWYTIAVIIFAFWNRKKLPLSFNVFILLSVLLPLLSGSVMSMTRFVSLLFPLYFLVSKPLFSIRYKYLILFFFLGLHYFTYLAWIKNLIS